MTLNARFCTSGVILRNADPLGVTSACSDCISDAVMAGLSDSASANKSSMSL
jgi:hypothetical protein